MTFLRNRTLRNPRQALTARDQTIGRRQVVALGDFVEEPGRHRAFTIWLMRWLDKPNAWLISVWRQPSV
jgi:hypothetical protein